MRQIKLTIAALLVTLPLAANATLIGDTIDAGIFVNGNRILSFGLEDPFTVEAGNGDIQQYSTVFLLDVEANGFSIDYIGCCQWTSGLEFRIFDLDWIGDVSGMIVDLVIDTNVAGWDDSRASFTADSATFLFGGLEHNEDTYFNVAFVTDHASVPEPATLALLGISLFGMGLARRRKKV